MIERKYIETNLYRPKKQKIVSKLNNEDLANFCEQILLNSDDKSNRQKLLNYLENIFCENGLHCKVFYMGSTVNGIGFYDSDFDIYIQPLSMATNNDNKQSVLINPRTYLQKIKQIICKHSPLPKSYNTLVILARCPIVKLTPKLIPLRNFVELDINVTHPLGVFNSKVINFLISFDVRILRLCTILKYWAKVNDLINSEGLKSYTLSFMVIFFLQNCEPQFIKSLDNLWEYSRNFRFHLNDCHDDYQELYRKCNQLVQHADKIPSIFDMLHQFFT